MYQPTAGVICYNGYNIFTNMEAFRRDLGLCPQEDMLIREISVWQHLMIFGMVSSFAYNGKQIN